MNIGLRDVEGPIGHLHCEQIVGMWQVLLPRQTKLRINFVFPQRTNKRGLKDFCQLLL